MNRGFLLLALIAAGALVLWSQQAAADTGDAGSWDPFSMAEITEDPSTWPAGDRIWDICRAIALAEGYNGGSGVAPFDLNNPGDLSPGDEHGCATIAEPEFHGGSYIIHFATAWDGFNALYQKIRAIAAGQSKVYQPQWSWERIAEVYAGDSGNWARNVAGALNVAPTSSLQDYVGVV